MQWAVGLELLLLINDPWRIFLTTDHPNGACFWRYPEIIHLLMNADFRRERVKKLPAKALKRIVLADLDREYSLYEIAIITSAGPARALGLSQKGHLGVGADADVAIYNQNPDGELMFRYPRYVIKGGEIVVEEGDIRTMVEGREFLVQPAYDPTIEDFLRPLFQQHYTMSFDNYPVELDRIEHRSPECNDRRPRGDSATARHARSATAVTMITLTLKEQPTVPLEAEVLSPDVIGRPGARRDPRPAGVPGQAAVPARRLLRRRRRRPATSWRSAATRPR